MINVYAGMPCYMPMASPYSKDAVLEIILMCLSR